MPGPSTPASALLRVEIPGEPVAQGRGRAIPTPAGIRVMDPPRARAWKGVAQVWMLQARLHAGIHAPFARPLAVTVEAYWPRPQALRGDGRPWRTSRPDADNVAKAALDAGNGVLWLDDGQVVVLTVRKQYAGREEPPRVVVLVEDVGEPA